MRCSRHSKLFTSMCLILGVGLLARMFEWSGPGASVPLEPRLLLPAILIVGAWGIARVLKRNGGDS